MIKYERPEDYEDLDFVDPHVVQPMTVACDQEVSSNSILNESHEDSNATLCGDSSVCSSRSDLMMEHCINLDLYLSPIMSGGNPMSVDELNTPVFDIQNELNVINIPDITADINNRNPFTFTNGLQIQQQPISINREVGGAKLRDICGSDGDSLVRDQGLLDMGVDDADINLDEYDFLTDYNDAIAGFPEALDEAVIISNENTNSNSFPEAIMGGSSNNKFALKLDLSGKFLATDVLQTPDVISTICSIEQDYVPTITGAYVKPEDILPVKIEEIASTASPFDFTPAASPTQTLTWTTLTTPEPSTSRKRKLRLPSISEPELDDDDEEYLPPVRTVKAKRTVAKRGRPVKRASVSSDNSESNKYREMRDKNNEASRRSRQKRRVQEKLYDEEMEGLSVRNLQLKTQVGELEKSVKTLRDNLMTLLMAK